MRFEIWISLHLRYLYPIARSSFEIYSSQKCFQMVSTCLYKNNVTPQRARSLWFRRFERNVWLLENVEMMCFWRHRALTWECIIQNEADDASHKGWCAEEHGHHLVKYRVTCKGVVMRDRQTEVDRQTDRSRQTHTQGEGEREKERYKVREGTKQNQMFTEVTRIRMLQ